MHEIFSRPLPHTLIRLPNIIFDHEIRRIGWPRSPEELSLFAKQAFVIIHLLVWGAVICGLPGSPRSDTAAGVFVFFANLGLSFAADVYYMAVTLGQANRATLNAEWDILRMTPLHTADILAAKTAAAEIRGWRWMALETAMRATGLEFVALATFALIFISLYRPIVIAALGPLAAFALCLLLEPFWRMRALVAFSMAIGVEVRSTTKAFLTGIAVVLGVVLLRLFVFGLLGGAILGAFLSASSLFPVFQNFYCMAAPFVSAGLVILLYGFYAHAGRWAAERAAQHLERGD